MEAGDGIEPSHGAFAEPGLTTWLPRRSPQVSCKDYAEFHVEHKGSRESPLHPEGGMRVFLHEFPKGTVEAVLQIRVVPEDPGSLGGGE